MRNGDGFAVLVIDACLVVYSGSYTKCIDFIANNKHLAYSQGLAVVARKTAEKVLSDSENDIVEPVANTTLKREELPIPF